MIVRPKDIAPDIFRKRLLVEAFYTASIDESSVRKFMKDVAAHLGLRAYGEPVVFAPASGMGREENSGYDAFIPLIDSGISGYFWSKRKFLSVLFYTCAEFDNEKAVQFTKDTFGATGEVSVFEF